MKAAEEKGKIVGFHAHNNQNLAFANTIETLSYGVSYLDASMQAWVAAQVIAQWNYYSDF